MPPTLAPKDRERLVDRIRRNAARLNTGAVGRVREAQARAAGR